MDRFVKDARLNNKKYFILCYCQFSSARAPKLIDILNASEKDIMIEDLSDQSTLQISEQSRFIPLVIDGGYNDFHAQYPELCKIGYIREDDGGAEGKKCRSAYELDIVDSCASRVLGKNPNNNVPQVGRLTKKTRSFCSKPGFSLRPCYMNSENEDDCNVDTQETSSSFDCSDEESDLSFLHRTTSENVL